MLYYILFDTNLTPMEAVIHFLITILVYMVSLTIHEFAHAFVAFKCGDPTAKQNGRMTLNPFRHLDMMGFVIFILLGVGWAKPVPTNPLNYKKYKKGTRAVSISGVLANFILGLLSAVIYTVLFATVGNGGGVPMEYIYSILVYFMLINSFLVMFNIMPIPPMDGFNFISTFAKANSKFIKFMIRNGLRILFAFLLVGFATDLLFGFDVFTVYLRFIFDFVYVPITWLGV